MPARRIVRLVSATLVGATLLCGSAFAAPPGKPFTSLQQQIDQAASALRVLDASGTQVGDVVGISTLIGSGATVVLDVDGQLLLLAVGTQGFGGTTTGVAFFVGPGCVDGPYIDAIHARGFFPRVAAIGGTTILVGNDETPVARLMGSQLSTTGTCTPFVPTMPFLSVSAVAKTLPFTPPFRIER